MLSLVSRACYYRAKHGHLSRSHRFGYNLSAPRFCALLGTLSTQGQSSSAQSSPAPNTIVLHAARLLDVESGRITTPGEILVQGNLIAEVGTKVTHPPSAQMIDLGDTTLLPGLIDAHVHLFLHPGAEDLQTVQESVPQRTILATLAARDDLMAGFTAERDLGTEGAGSAGHSGAQRHRSRGSIPGPRLRISGNAISILGGHEDAIGYNPEQHVLGNATYANNADELVPAIREQIKLGADFIKIYETGTDSVVDGHVSSAVPSTHGSGDSPLPSTESLRTDWQSSRRACHGRTGNTFCGARGRRID